MRILLLAVSLILGACVDTSGSDNLYCYSDGPIVSNLVLAPASAVVGEGGGDIVVNASVDYKWRDSAKIILFHYRIEDASGTEILKSDIYQNLKKSGSFPFSIPMTTQSAQTYTVRVRAMDECFENSKWVQVGFDVAALAAVANKTGYATARLNGFVYLIGGEDGHGQASNALLQYDAATRQLAAKAPMPEGRTFAAAAAHDGVIYVFGGRAHGSDYDSTFAYNAITDSWTSVAPMSRPMAMGNAITVDGTIYVDSGVNGLHSYDPLLDLWTSYRD